MKRILTSVFVVPLMACALGEIDSGGPGTAGGGGSAGAAMVGAAGAGGRTGDAGSTGGGGTAGSSRAGTGGITTVDGGRNGGATAGAAGGGTACGTGIVPADVAAVISGRCVICHSNPPKPAVPTALTTYALLAAPSMSDPTRSVAALALARLQDVAKPMPPDPFPPATSAEIAAFQRWISAGLPKTSCPDGGASGDGGQATDGGTIVDPYDTPPVCTSKTTWTRANHGDQKMNPGLACITCHTSMNKGPRFALAGTLFPTAHEPDLCNGGTVVTGARVVITGSNGQTQTLTPNTAGNFSFEGTIAKPYTAKVTYMGRERVMVESQTSGDCNDCHAQNGAMKAPGRIMVP
jgi:hypothetical protein